MKEYNSYKMSDISNDINSNQKLPRNTKFHTD